jgi:hypothetical protein
LKTRRMQPRRRRANLCVPLSRMVQFKAGDEGMQSHTAVHALTRALGRACVHQCMHAQKQSPGQAARSSRCRLAVRTAGRQLSCCRRPFWLAGCWPAGAGHVNGMHRVRAENLPLSRGGIAARCCAVLTVRGPLGELASTGGDRAASS